MTRSPLAGNQMSVAAAVMALIFLAAKRSETSRLKRRRAFSAKLLCWQETLSVA